MTAKDGLSCPLKSHDGSASPVYLPYVSRQPVRRSIRPEDVQIHEILIKKGQIIFSIQSLEDLNETAQGLHIRHFRFSLSSKFRNNHPGKRGIVK